MMKKFLLTLLMVAGIGIGAAYALDVEGFRYDGIAKVKGEPLDYWATVTFKQGQARISLAKSVTIKGSYEIVTSGGKTTLSITTTSGKNIRLTSTDGGASFEGPIPFRGQDTRAWLLKVPATQTPCNLPDAELDKTVGSPDGYTAFVRIKYQTLLLSATSDFTLDASTHTFTMTCDNQAMQKIFSKMHGSYKVTDGTLIMTDISGKMVKGTIYDDGLYIVVPLGSSGGMDIELVLIR